MLQNAYFLAKIGADTAENEQHFAEILPKPGNYRGDGVIVDHVLEQFGNLVNGDRAVLERCRVPPIPFNFRSR